MTSILYRVERNPLTKSGSYKLRFLPQGVAGYRQVAERVALKHPGASVEQIMNHLKSAFDEINGLLAEGMQVTLEDALTFQPSFRVRLDHPDDPLPPMDELLRLSVSATRPFVKALQDAAELERVSSEEKAPSILSASDTTLELNNVLDPAGVLRLTGSHLFFDRDDPESKCVLAGTRNGSRTQSRFADISNSEILVVPSVPAQANPWNNEYTVSITTRYTAHGSLRTGTYGRMLRSPLSVDMSSLGETGAGILTDNADAPYASVIGGTATEDERLRIRADYNQQTDQLTFALLALDRNGPTGLMVPVPGNGEYTLPGFAGSAVSALEIEVTLYEDLKAMIRNKYDSRVEDILNVQAEQG